MADVTDWAAWSRQAVATMNARNQSWIARYGLERAPYRWDLAKAELSSIERPTTS
jgi:hypothetical protein